MDKSLDDKIISVEKWKQQAHVNMMSKYADKKRKHENVQM